MTITELRRDLRQPEEAKQFIISDLRSLGWYIRQIGLLDEQIAQIKEAERQEVEEIRLRAAQLVKQCQSSQHFLQDRYEPQAQAYVRSEMPKLCRKSVPTLWGLAGFRRSGGSVEITDMGAAVEFAERHGYEVRVEKTAHKTPLKKHIETTGELPPGVEYKPAEERFYVEYSRPAEFDDEEW